jgi:mannosyl-oligosaccharide alpha-1,2-mannosidase
VDVTSLPVSGSEASESKRAAVVGAIRHAWGGYVKYAWGADELKPISKRSTDWIGLGLTILDSLDVLWMAGLTDEFTKGVEWIRQSLDFRKQRMVSFFETTIRCLGGLVTAYELSGDAVLLEKATDLGERLGKAFATPSGLPYTTISLASGQHAIPGWTGGNLLLAEVGTVQLEFFALAKHSGRQEFHDKAQKVIDVLDQNGGPTDSDGGRMWPIHIRPDSGKLTGTQISWGAMGDSYYEYLLKMWLYTGKKVPQYKRMYLESVRAMRKQLIFTENGYTFLAESNNKKVIKKMDHLVCFVPGMLALGAQNIPEVHDEHMKLAAALTETCHAMYDKQRTGLAPEFVRFSGRGMEVGAGHNLLRPETIESLFYMWRFTKDPKYREWGWKMFLGFEKYTKVPTGGYSGIKNVNQENSAKDDTMQTFWIAESLKYFLLLFSDDNALDLTTHTINTEAHPMRNLS